MQKKIIVITDYKGFFESKQKSKIYRGGVDLELVKSITNSRGWEFETCSFGNLDFEKLNKERPFILYSSSEDNNGLYKSFVEDIIFHLESLGLFVIPKYGYLKAHNNKVSMELLRERIDHSDIRTIRSQFFGTLEELTNSSTEFTFPVVIKKASGAMSRGVAKANSQKELECRARKISRSVNFKYDLKEVLRIIKYKKRYIRESSNRGKFIVQNYIENLKNDWKVLVYGNRCYILYRENRKKDFRASGSGLFEFRKEIPIGILDYAYSIKECFNVPLISLDIGYDEDKFHLIEFQLLYFGTTTIEKAPFYFVKNGNSWRIIDEKSVLEEVYIDSVIEFLIKFPGIL